MKLVLEIRKASLYPKIDVFFGSLSRNVWDLRNLTGLKFFVESFGGGLSSLGGFLSTQSTFQNSKKSRVLRIT